jgi:hypothetical protein
MKKLFVLALVLSMTTMAGATMTLTLAGPADGSNIAVHASGFVSGDGITIAVVVDAGSLSGGVANVPPAPDATMVFGPASDPEGPTGGMLIDGMDGIICGIDSFSGTATAGAGNYINQIVWSGTSATAYLYSTVDFETWTATGAQMTLIPEPMTMALLGLGGLFLRRRK